MSENTDVMKKGYDAFARGDMDTIRFIWTDDIEWEGPNYEPLPNAGRFHGADEIFEMFGRLPEHWDDFKVTPDEYLEDGETVVALGHVEGRAKSTG